jgi:hypothetical protein
VTHKPFSETLEEYLREREMRDVYGRHRQWHAVETADQKLEELAAELDAAVDRLRKKS